MYYICTVICTTPIIVILHLYTCLYYTDTCCTKLILAILHLYRRLKYTNTCCTTAMLQLSVLSTWNPWVVCTTLILALLQFTPVSFTLILAVWHMFCFMCYTNNWCTTPLHLSVQYRYLLHYTCTVVCTTQGLLYYTFTHMYYTDNCCATPAE